MECSQCQSEKSIKNGKHHHQNGKAIQNYLCKGCGKRFSERTGSVMSRLRTPVSIVSFALKMRSERMGIRASGRECWKNLIQVSWDGSKNWQPSQSNSRYWIEAKAGLKDPELFAKATKTAWQWAKMSQYISMVYRWRKEICPTTMANGKCIPQIHRSKQGDVALIAVDKTCMLRIPKDCNEQSRCNA